MGFLNFARPSTSRLEDGFSAQYTRFRIVPRYQITNYRPDHDIYTTHKNDTSHTLYVTDNSGSSMYDPPVTIIVDLWVLWSKDYFGIYIIISITIDDMRTTC